MNQNNLLPKTNQNELPKKRRAWRAPEIVDVGSVIDATEVGTQNVRDNQNDQLRTYHDPACVRGDDEVDLGGR